MSKPPLVARVIHLGWPNFNPRRQPLYMVWAPPLLCKYRLDRCHPLVRPLSWRLCPYPGGRQRFVAQRRTLSRPDFNVQVQPIFSLPPERAFRATGGRIYQPVGGER